MSDSDGEEAGVALVEMRPDELQDKIEAADNKLMALEMSIRSNAGSQRTIQEDINDKITDFSYKINTEISFFLFHKFQFIAR